MRSNFVPIFYVRGFNAPFTEGHIQILRMMIKSLSCRNIQSVVFNYKYCVNETNVEQSFGENFLKCEQKIPIVRRDTVVGRKKAVVACTSLFEALASLKFMFLEGNLDKSRYIVNITNCFRYPRLLARRMFNVPVLLHFYMKDATNQMKTAISISDFFIVTSRTVANHLRRVCDVSREKIGVVYPPTDTNLFKPLGKKYARHILGLPEKDRIILYIGNLNVARFPENVVFEMMKKFVNISPKVVLHIYAPERIENARRAFQILRQAKTFGLTKHVKIETRNLSDAEKSLIYNAANIFLFPSTGGGAVVEPPLAVLEAMSTGLPTVSNDIPSLRELVTEGSNGFLAPMETELVPYHEKIDLLLSNSDIASRIGCNSRKTISSNASIDVAGTKLCEIYQNLLRD